MSPRYFLLIRKIAAWFTSFARTRAARSGFRHVKEGIVSALVFLGLLLTIGLIVVVCPDAVTRRVNKWRAAMVPLAAFCAASLASFGVLGLAVVVIWDSFQSRVVIEPIKLPSSLVETGLTEEAAAQQVVDEVRQILFVDLKGAGMPRSTDVVGREANDKLKIPTPTGPLPIHLVSGVIRGAFCHLHDHVDLFPGDPCRWEIRMVGEVILSGGRVELHLHTLTREPIGTVTIPNDEGIAKLFRLAARNVVREHYPREYQAYLTQISKQERAAPSEAKDNPIPQTSSGHRH